MKIIFLFILFWGSTNTVSAQTLFEAYYQVRAAEKPIGYVISQVKFDKDKKQFRSAYLLRTKDFSESWVTTSDEGLGPLTLDYNSLQGKVATTISVSREPVKASKKNAKKKDEPQELKFKGFRIAQGKRSPIELTAPKGVFWSNMLAYVMLGSPQGLRKDIKFEYEAFAEEDFELTKGSAFIQSEEKYLGTQAFVVLNEFKGSKFISRLSPQGQVLASEAPVEKISTRIVSKQEATQGFEFPEAQVKQLFGEVPVGETHPLPKVLDPKLPKGVAVPPGKKMSTEKTKEGP